MRVLPLPVIVSLPPSPSNSLKAAPLAFTPALPALVLDAVKPVASNVSAKAVPRTASTDRSVSVPILASPVTLPAARLTLIPAATAASML
jgi:hypothetical protein